MPHKLSNSFVGKITPISTEQEFSDSEISGLKLRVSKSGRKTFYQFYKFDGKLKKYRIGKFGDIGIPAAHEVARKIKGKRLANCIYPGPARVTMMTSLSTDIPRVHHEFKLIQKRSQPPALV